MGNHIKKMFKDPGHAYVIRTRKEIENLLSSIELITNTLPNTRDEYKKTIENILNGMYERITQLTKSIQPRINILKNLSS